MNREQSAQRFCRAYLRTMDPDRAAAEIGRKDGTALLEREDIQARLERMRSCAAGQLRREDVLRRLAQLAFGQTNDVARLALRAEDIDPRTLDLSAVAELRVTEKGVEVKLVDRVRALETLCRLLEYNDGCSGAEALYQALERAADTLEGEDGA